MTLTALDRCDRCGAQAYATATLPSGILMLCGHHLRENRDALALAGAVIHDETAALNAPPRTTPTRCER